MTTALDRYLETAARIGCPPDQLRNFRLGGYAALPMQLRFSAAARACDEPGGPTQVALGGSRGPGKSHGIFAQICLDDCQRQKGLTTLYLRKVGKQAREQMEDLRRKVLHSTPHKYNRYEGVIYFPNGSRLLMGHFNRESDIDNYLGFGYDAIAVEEATMLTLTKRKALRDSNRSSIPGWRSRMYESANPGGVGHAWFKKTYVTPYLLNQQDGGDSRFFPGTVDDNPHLDPDYAKKLEENTGWRLRAYRYGDWEIAAGQFFTTFNSQVHVIKPRPIQAHWRVWPCMDYGFNHPTTIYLLAMDEDDNIYVVDEHWQRRWLPEQHAVAFFAMLERWGISYARLTGFPAGSDIFNKKGDDGESIADKYKGLGMRLKRANMDRINGAAEVLSRLGDPERGIPPRLYIFNTCYRLIECLPAMEHDPNRPEDVLKVDVDEEDQGGDDPYDGLRYGLMEASRPRMTSGQVDFYAKTRQTAQAPPPARSQAEVERLLEQYG